MFLMMEDKAVDENNKIQLFEDKRVRTAWDEEEQEWYFSVVDVVSILTDQQRLETRVLIGLL